MLNVCYYIKYQYLLPRKKVDNRPICDIIQI